MYFIKTKPFLKKIYSNCIWKINDNSKSLYLTFDDGPHPEITTEVLSVLNSYNIRATFFCVGKNAQKYPETLNKLTASNHCIGNHTFNHIDGWKTDTQNYLQNIKKAQAILPSTNLFRPPYGRIKRSQIKALKSVYDIVMWDVLSADFAPSVTPEKCLKNVTRNIESGSIIVFHDSEKAYKNMIYALPRFIETALTQGYRFKPIKATRS